MLLLLAHKRERGVTFTESLACLPTCLPVSPTMHNRPTRARLPPQHTTCRPAHAPTHPPTRLPSRLPWQGRRGAVGDDYILTVPLGTVVKRLPLPLPPGKACLEAAA